MLELKELKSKLTFNDKTVYICAFIFLIIIFSIFYTNYFSNKLKIVSNLLLRRTNLEDTLNIKKDNLSALTENIFLIEEMKKNAVPRQISAIEEATAILYVLNLVKENKLAESYLKVQPRNRFDERMLRPLQITASGDYDDCMNFLYDIQHGKYYYMPDKIEMSRIDGEIDKININVNMYLIIENLEIEETKSIIEKINKDERKNIKNPFTYGK